MADLSDVELALVSAAMASLYPAGTSEASVIQAPIRIYRGLPAPGPLEADLSKGVVNVSIFAVPESTRNTTRWGPLTQVRPGAVTLSIDIDGASASFAGTAGIGQVAGLLIDDQVFVYRTSAGNTPLLVAAMLAQSIRNARSCWLSGTTIDIPGAYRLVGRVAADGVTATEWGRQEQSFRISVWCPDPHTRDQLCGFLGGALACTSFLTLSDGSAGRIRYRSTASVDDQQDAGQYRRDMIYDVEYGTVTTEISPAMLFGDLNWAGGANYA